MDFADKSVEPHEYEPWTGGGPPDRSSGEPCQRCGSWLPSRPKGCAGNRCPNCGYPYPHGDCSD